MLKEWFDLAVENLPVGTILTSLCWAAALIGVATLRKVFSSRKVNDEADVVFTPVTEEELKLNELFGSLSNRLVNGGWKRDPDGKIEIISFGTPANGHIVVRLDKAGKFHVTIGGAPIQDLFNEDQLKHLKDLLQKQVINLTRANKFQRIAVACDLVRPSAGTCDQGPTTSNYRAW